MAQGSHFLLRRAQSVEQVGAVPSDSAMVACGLHADAKAESVRARSTKSYSP